MPNNSQTRPVDIARALGLSRGRISQLAAAGMPTDSVEAAESWRKARGMVANMKASTNSTREKGEPGELFDPGRRPRKRDLKRVDLEGARARLIRAELLSFEQLERAQTRSIARPKETAAALRLLRDATAARVSIEREIMQNLQISEDLIPHAKAVKLLADQLEPLKFMLQTMPAALAARCNPTDPELARDALREEVNRICEAMRNGNGDKGQLKGEIENERQSENTTRD